jgi:hypothetical protein
MDILDIIRNAQGGSAVQQLGQQFGLDETEVSSALSALVPALAAGFQNNASSPQGLDGLLGALTGGQHQRYMDDPGTLSQPDTAADGNGILGHIFGSKDVSRQVASQAASQTGIGEGVLKAMLPVVAAMMMGAMSKRVAQPAAAGAGIGGDTGLGGGLLSMLAPALDANRDGSMVDDVAGLVGRLLSGR